MSTNHNEEEAIEDKTLTRNDPVYLVMEMPDTGKYEITCVGIHCVDSDIDGLYDSFDALPLTFCLSLLLKQSISKRRVNDLGLAIIDCH